MPRDSGGIYSLPTGYEAVSGETILPSQHNPPLEDLAAAMTASLPRNGAAPMTGNLAMGANKITGLAAGANPADAVRLDQLPDASDFGVSLAVAGLTMSTNGSTVVTVSPGAAVASDGSVLRLTSAMAKTLSSWAAGTGNGGLDTGSEANSTWYHVHLIGNLTSGAVDVLLSASFASPTLPSGYAVSVPIGAIYNDSGGNIDEFVQQGDHFFWATNPLPNDVAITGLPSANGTLAPLSVPSGVQVIAIVDVWVSMASGNFLWVSSPDVPDISPSGTDGRGHGPFGPTSGGLELRRRTNTSRQVRFRASGGSTGNQVYASTVGWIYPRGGQ